MNTDNTKKANENKVNENLATGASAAVGTMAGVVAGAAINSEVHAQEAPKPEIVDPMDPVEPVKPVSPVKPEEPVSPEKPVTPVTPEEPVTPVNPVTPEEPEVEVVGYDRITNEDGSQMDVAVLSVNGNEIGVFDVDLDGRADLAACDLNHNGVIEDGEVEYIGDQYLPMQPLADAAGFNPLYAENDMPDYVNDADVDTYMA